MDLGEDFYLSTHASLGRWCGNHRVLVAGSWHENVKTMTECGRLMLDEQRAERDGS